MAKEGLKIPPRQEALEQAVNRVTIGRVGGIPIGLLGIFFFISPEFIGLLFTTSMGHIMLGVAGGLEVLGFFVIKKIVDIEV